VVKDEREERDVPQTATETEAATPSDVMEVAGAAASPEAVSGTEGGEEEGLTAEGDLPVEEEKDPETAERAARRAQAKWYVIHCYSGMEHKVKRNLEARIESMGVQDKVFEVIVPTEETIELRDGVRRRVERRVFPGYILVHMILDDESWHVVRHTPGVTGFVGIGSQPTPLSDEEVDEIMRRIEAPEPQLKVDFRVGERVRITSGPFADFTGTVVEIYPDKGKARVAVSFFNRETPVEVDFLQLEKV